MGLFDWGEEDKPYNGGKRKYIVSYVNIAGYSCSQEVWDYSAGGASNQVSCRPDVKYMTMTKPAD